VLDQKRDQAMVQAGDPFKRIAPAQAMVYDRQVGALRDRRLEKRERRVHAHRHPSHAAGAAGHLQAVMRAVLKPRDRQLAIQPRRKRF
jgi:hypothetical protein